jgi:UDP-N-acetylmuramate dehydrogenase
MSFHRLTVEPLVRERLLKRLPCPVKTGEPLALHTTFRIGGPAEVYAEPRSERELSETLRLVRDEQVPMFYLGLGSNILVSDDGFDGVVIRAQGELCRIRIERDQVCAGPGARLLDLTAFAAARGLSGMEALSGIPGSVGGGLYMNAGAYGMEISDAFAEADVLERDGRGRTLRRTEIRFAYRSAPELESVIVLESRYTLRPGERRSIYAEMRRVWKLRRAKQPLEFPSAGSIFKRPTNDFAGRLIEAVGAKGERNGGAMVSPKHAGIFVNVGGATAADVAALVRRIRYRVYERFGVLLEPEVKPVGFKDDPFAIAS